MTANSTAPRKAAKTGNKTGKATITSPRSGAVIPTGAHPGNTGGKKGRSGRKPEWLKDFCDELIADPDCQIAVKAVLTDKAHPAFATMWKTVAERAHGRPAQAIELTGKEGAPIQVRGVLKWGKVEIPL